MRLPQLSHLYYFVLLFLYTFCIAFYTTFSLFVPFCIIISHHTMHTVAQVLVIFKDIIYG
jgi:hypothetical protein